MITLDIVNVPPQKLGSATYYHEIKNSPFIESLRQILYSNILPSECICEFAMEILDAYQWENYLFNLIGLNGSVAHSTWILQSSLEWFIGGFTLYNKNKSAAKRSFRLIYINYFFSVLSRGLFYPKSS